jgi:hypothetical protein
MLDDEELSRWNGINGLQGPSAISFVDTQTVTQKVRELRARGKEYRWEMRSMSEGGLVKITSIS